MDEKFFNTEQADSCQGDRRWSAEAPITSSIIEHRSFVHLFSSFQLVAVNLLPFLATHICSFISSYWLSPFLAVFHSLLSIYHLYFAFVSLLSIPSSSLSSFYTSHLCHLFIVVTHNFILSIFRLVFFALR